MTYNTSYTITQLDISWSLDEVEKGLKVVSPLTQDAPVILNSWHLNHKSYNSVKKKKKKASSYIWLLSLLHKIAKDVIPITLGINVKPLPWLKLTLLAGSTKLQESWQFGNDNDFFHTLLVCQQPSGLLPVSETV